jgi:hypothetical protein
MHYMGLFMDFELVWLRHEKGTLGKMESKVKTIVNEKPRQNMTRQNNHTSGSFEIIKWKRRIN